MQQGDVDYSDLEGDEPRHERLEAGDRIVIPPDVLHRVDPSTDALFFVQFHREPDAGMVPDLRPEPPPSPRAAGPWDHRGRDLDDPDEIFEMVTREVHEHRALTGEALDRWLEIFHETIDTGWAGPNAERAKKRGTGMAWAMAQRLLGKGVWRPGAS